MSKALDDPKRAVRQEAVRCQQAWSVLWIYTFVPLSRIAVVLVLIFVLVGYSSPFNRFLFCLDI